MANVILTNGARLYVDHAHPEELAPAAARAVPTPGGGAGTDRPHRAHARPAGHKFSFWPPEHGDGHVRRWHHTACVTVPPDTRLGEYLTTQLRLVPGLLVTAGAVVVAFLATTLLPTVSSLLVAVALGAVGANAGLLRPAMRPGLAFTQRRVLRVGIVLLGLQLAVGDILGLGASGIGVVVLTVVLTFLGTLLLGRLLHVGRDLTVLVASGFSICGAAAVAAVHASTEADEEDVALAIALVTIYGTVAMIALPLVAGPLALTAAETGTWAGAGVHEVAQVVVAASAVGSSALAVAVVVKLSRVVLLAPLVLILGALQRQRAGVSRAEGRPPLVPLFVVGFLLAAALRSTGVLPQSVLDTADVLEEVALTAALFALGTGVRLRVLMGTGRRALLLGAAATLLAAGVSLSAVLVLM